MHMDRDLQYDDVAAIARHLHREVEDGTGRVLVRQFRRCKSEGGGLQSQ